MKQSPLVRKAEKLLEKHMFEHAQDVLVDAVEKEPNNPEVYFLLGETLCKLERFAEAIVVLQKADSLFPRHPRIYHLLGWAIFMNGDLPAGRTFMELALGAEPADIQIMADLAVLEMQAGNFDAARAHVMRAKKIAPDDEMLAEVLMMIDRMETLLEKSKKRTH